MVMIMSDSNIDAVVFLQRSLGSGYLPDANIGPLEIGEQARLALFEERNEDLGHAARHNLDDVGEIRWEDKEAGLGWYRGEQQIIETVKLTPADVTEEEWDEILEELRE